MFFKFSKHLRKKLIVLGVSQSEVVKAIQTAKKWVDKRGDKNWHAEFGGLEVTYKFLDGSIFIITVKTKW